MEVAEIIATVVTSFVLVFPIVILHEGNIKLGGIGIGDRALPAPQAGVLVEILRGDGSAVAGGEVVAVIDSEGAASCTSPCSIASSTLSSL